MSDITADELLTAKENLQRQYAGGEAEIIFRHLRLLIPGIPERATKLTLRLQCGYKPLIEVEYIPEQTKLDAAGNVIVECEILTVTKDATRPENDLCRAGM